MAIQLLRVFVLAVLLIISVVEARQKGGGYGNSHPCQSNVVTTLQGQLRGQTLTSFGGRSFRAFVGVPYAAPPTGHLRFRAPETHPSWKGIRNATEDGSICPQNWYLNKTWTVVGNEDCLFLNVYVPKTRQQRALPVMVWFHDGAFIWGSKNGFGPEYLMDKNVILVTINYRLGILGFLSTGDDVAPGNWGLKDQVASLKWVQNNIVAFGGDPNSVTIFGGSAGSISVQHHMLSPLSIGLFHRGISQSGVSLMPAGLTTDNRKKAFRTGQLVECPEQESKALVDCLRTKSAESLSLAILKFWEWRTNPTVTFGPVVEPESAGNQRFLTKTPRELLQSGEYNQLPWITGINPNDAEFSMRDFFTNMTLRRELRDNYRHLLPIIFDFRDANNPGDVAEKIWNFYLQDSPITDENILNVTDMYSDRVFFVAAVDSANLQASTSSAPVFFYRLDYHSIYSLCNCQFLPKGVCHADDLAFMFKVTGRTPCTNTTALQDEYRIKDIFVEMWTNFATTGNPTPRPSRLVPVTWTPVTAGTQLNFLRIDLKPEMDVGLYDDRIKFWNSLPLPENEGRDS